MKLREYHTCREGCGKKVLMDPRPLGGLWAGICESCGTVHLHDLLDSDEHELEPEEPFT